MWPFLVGASIVIVLSPTVLYTLRRQLQRHPKLTSSNSLMTTSIPKLVRLVSEISSGDAKLVIAFLLVASSVDHVYGIEFPQQTRELLAMLRPVVSLGLDNVFDGFIFQCIGVDGYLPRAILWICSPLYIYILVLLAAALRAHCVKPKEVVSWSLLAKRTSPTMFRLLFLIYPSLIRFAFSAFDCHAFDDGNSWMKADVVILCNSAEHQRAMYCAGVVIIVYVAGESGVA